MSDCNVKVLIYYQNTCLLGYPDSFWCSKSLKHDETGNYKSYEILQKLPKNASTAGRDVKKNVSSERVK